jgi:TonB family protein
MRRISVVVVSLVLAAGGRAAADTIPADKLPEIAVTATTASKRPEVSHYLRALHEHVHRRWADNFLMLIQQKLPLTNPLNVAARDAEVDVVISPDGQLLSSTITKSSGFPGFDDAIGEVLRDSVPFPLPPPSARSDDDRLHLHWVFARDQRRCAGMTVTHVQEAPEVALPKLLHTGRRDEAAERIAAARAAGAHAEPLMTMLASDWLQQAIHAPWMTVHIARVLAEHGEREAVTWLRSALRRPELARDAGEALSALKVPVCPLVKAQLEGGAAWADKQVAAAALARSGETACAPALVKLLENDKARADARAAAAVALGNIDDEAARKSLAGVAKNETNATVRAAAMLAQIRPGAGRGKVIAMESILRDPSPEIRAAAAAGVVRAGGDTNLADLYVLFKDSDARPALAALRELDRLPTQESTNLVARLARRPQLEVQKLAAEILVRRQARGSFSVLKPFLEPATDPALRGLALVAADDTLLASLGNDPHYGYCVYRAYLARGDRDRAADWLLAHAAQMPMQDQGDAMADWLATAETPQATARR